MSVVACKVYENHIEFAADSITLSGYSQRTDLKATKLTKVGEIIIGSAGQASEAGLFQIFLKSHKPKTPSVDDVLEFVSEFSDWKNKKIGKPEVENCYLIGIEKYAFYIHDYFVVEVDKFHAIGAGDDFAPSALYLGHSPKEAVEVTCKLSPFCEGPVIEFSLSK